MITLTIDVGSFYGGFLLGAIIAFVIWMVST